MRIKATTRSFEPHPEGTFRGHITNIDQAVSKYHGKPELVFTITTTPIHGEPTVRTIKQWTSPSLTPQTNLGQLYMTISGQEIQDGLEIDTDKDLLHKSALVVVEHYQKDNGQTGNRVSHWQPLN